VSWSEEMNELGFAFLSLPEMDKFRYLTLSSQASRDITSGSQVFRNMTSGLRIISIHDIFSIFTLFANFLILFNLAAHVKWPLYPYLVHTGFSRLDRT